MRGKKVIVRKDTIAKRSKMDIYKVKSFLQEKKKKLKERKKLRERGGSKGKILQ